MTAAPRPRPRSTRGAPRLVASLALGVASLALGVAPPALDATTFAAKTDNAIAALDLRTGKVLWTHTPKTLSDAHFEVFPGRVVAYPNYSGDDRSNPMVFDMAGKPAALSRKARRRRLARSAVLWPPPRLRLANGWTLTGFSPGSTQTLRFTAGKAARTRWEIPTKGYPHAVRVWRNHVFYAFSYLSDEGVLYAHRVGKRDPVWTLDINQVIPRTGAGQAGAGRASSRSGQGTGRASSRSGQGAGAPLTRMSLEVIGDVLYIEANEHVLAVAPATGKVLWHRDLASDLGLKFQPDFFGGGLNLAVFARDGDVLVVSFEKRVVAIDLAAGKYLWHLEPDTFPHTPFPAAHGGRLYLTLGKKHRLHRVKPD